MRDLLSTPIVYLPGCWFVVFFPSFVVVVRSNCLVFNFSIIHSWFRHSIKGSSILNLHISVGYVIYINAASSHIQWAPNVYLILLLFWLSNDVRIVINRLRLKFMKNNMQKRIHFFVKPFIRLKKWWPEITWRQKKNRKTEKKQIVNQSAWWFQRKIKVKMSCYAQWRCVLSKFVGSFFLCWDNGPTSFALLSYI